MRLDQATTETEQTIIPNAVKRSSEMIHCGKGFKRSMVCISKELKMIGTFVEKGKYDNFSNFIQLQSLNILFILGPKTSSPMV